MRRWLLELHLYVALFCLPYMTVLGVSSILLNHGVTTTTERAWRAQLGPLAPGAPAEQAEAARAALGVRGSVIRERAKRDEAGDLAFRVLRPGRRFDVTVSPDGRASVAERDGGVLGVVRDLHVMASDEGTRWSRGWALYSDVTVAGVLFLIASGATRVVLLRRGRGLKLGFAVAGFACCAALAAWIW
jgi:hypothetical protein